MKHPTILLKLSIMIATMLFCATPARGTRIDDFDYELNSTKLTATITKYYGTTATGVLIPSSVSYSGKEYTVTVIGAQAFERNELTSVDIPTSVTTIGQSAFDGCAGLTSLIIPENISKIYDSAFRNCTGLTSVEFNATNCSTMGSTGHGVFSGCTSFCTLTIGNNVERIPYNSFNACTALTSVTIPNSVTFIGGSAFHYCTSMTSVVIGKGVKSIGDGAFAECKALTTVEFNATNCTNMGNGNTNGEAFRYCRALKTIIIGENVSNIPRTGFAGTDCDGIESIYVKASTPPIAPDNVFNNYNATLYVPKGTVDTYRNSAPNCWPKFLTIQESDFDFSGIEDAATDGIAVYGGDGFIDFAGAHGLDATIVSLDGKMLYQGETRRIELAKGMYLVRVGSHTSKVLVR